MVMVVFPLYMQSLNYPPIALGIATSLSACGAMVARPFAGYLTDKTNKKVAIFIGIFAFLISTLSLNFFPFLFALIIIRFVHGVGFSFGSTAKMAIATDSLPE
jgi:MFS family permease